MDQLLETGDRPSDCPRLRALSPEFWNAQMQPFYEKREADVLYQQLKDYVPDESEYRPTGLHVIGALKFSSPATRPLGSSPYWAC